jgi:hypothetical protein
VLGLHLDAQVFHDEHHLGAQVLHAIDRRRGEVAALFLGTEARVAAFFAAVFLAFEFFSFSNSFFVIFFKSGSFASLSVLVLVVGAEVDLVGIDADF